MSPGASCLWHRVCNRAPGRRHRCPGRVCFRGAPGGRWRREAGWPRARRVGGRQQVAAGEGGAGGASVGRAWACTSGLREIKAVRAPARPRNAHGRASRAGGLHAAAHSCAAGSGRQCGGTRAGEAGREHAQGGHMCWEGGCAQSLVTAPPFCQGKGRRRWGAPGLRQLRVVSVSAGWLRGHQRRSSTSACVVTAARAGAGPRRRRRPAARGGGPS